MYTCHYCGTEFQVNRKPSNPDRPFCSRSCAASFNNIKYPKRVKSDQSLCERCGSPTSGPKYSTCQSCRSVKAMTLGEFKSRKYYTDKHPSWLYSSIRTFARNWNSHLRNTPCQACGYAKHTEYAHIIPVSSFPDSATLSEINSEHNIYMLCPNCHWEFDNGLLPTESINARPVSVTIRGT